VHVMRTPMKRHALSGSLVVWLVLLIIVSGCGGGDGPPSQNEFRAAPGDELAMTAHREGKLVYEARYRWTEMPEAESGSGPQGPIPLFALLEQETHHDPDFRLVLPPKDPVTHEELRTFLRDHWDEYSGGTADRGWNLEDFIGFLHRHTICWEDFFDRWEDHRAAGGTLPQLVQRITDSARSASPETPFAIGDRPDTTGHIPSPPIADCFLVTVLTWPLFNPLFRLDTGVSTSILYWEDPLLFDYHEDPDTRPSTVPETVVTWKSHGLRRFTVSASFTPRITHNCFQYSPFTGLRSGGTYIKWLGVEADFGKVPLTVVPIWWVTITDVHNAGTESHPNPEGVMLVAADYVWLWQTFGHTYEFPFNGSHGFIKPKK
jgi:hypothetical protein